MEIDQKDIEALRREKYNNDKEADMKTDLARLAEGEPLAYVIGHIPFLGLSIDLESRPLIPRPETEWWTEELVAHINTDMIYHIIQQEKREECVVRVLDVCAGSGAIGLAVLKHCPSTQVSFAELMEEHKAIIQKNIHIHNLDASRADIRIGDLFVPFSNERFDIIATNPPYIPGNRTLPESVMRFEPHEALFAGTNGLDSIRRIVKEAPIYLYPGGKLWMECDTENIEHASFLAMDHGASYTKIRTDQYGRPRLLVAYY